MDSKAMRVVEHRPVDQQIEANTCKRRGYYAAAFVPKYKIGVLVIAGMLLTVSSGFLRTGILDITGFEKREPVNWLEISIRVTPEIETATVKGREIRSFTVAVLFN